MLSVSLNGYTNSAETFEQLEKQLIDPYYFPKNKGPRFGSDGARCFAVGRSLKAAKQTRPLTKSAMASSRGGNQAFQARLPLLSRACLPRRAGRQIGNVDGLAALDDAQAFADQTGEGYWVSEIHRVRGELFFAQCRDNQCRGDQPHDNAADRESAKRAEECFRKSLMLAQHHKAKSLELRAATSLAGLLQSYGDVDAAKATLEPVYAWFTEGFETADLVAAKRLLDDLK